MWSSPHPWMMWSILGSALIMFVTYFQVQVSVAINAWYGPFYDLIQAALTKRGRSLCERLLWPLRNFAGIAFVAVVVDVLNRFFVSHYIFRWRTAMNHHYVALDHARHRRRIAACAGRYDAVFHHHGRAWA